MLLDFGISECLKRSCCVHLPANMHEHVLFCIFVCLTAGGSLEASKLCLLFDLCLIHCYFLCLFTTRNYFNKEQATERIKVLQVARKRHPPRVALAPRQALNTPIFTCQANTQNQQKIDFVGPVQRATYETWSRRTCDQPSKLCFLEILDNWGAGSASSWLDRSTWFSHQAGLLFKR